MNTTSPAACGKAFSSFRSNVLEHMVKEQESRELELSQKYKADHTEHSHEARAAAANTIQVEQPSSCEMALLTLS